MYVCTECGHLFEHPQHIVDPHGLDTPPYEEHDCCPECFGWAFFPTFTCDSCDEYITDDYVRVGQACYCSECYTLYDLSE